MLADSPGTIVLPTSEIGRFTLFMVCLASTQQPDGTNLGISASASVVENLNGILEKVREDDEWVWVLGDDHSWEPDCLMKMLAAMDDTPEADIMVPLVVKRNPPWHVVIFKDAGFDDVRGVPQWQPWPWEEIPGEGAFEVDAAGSAGMLVRRHVLDTMGYPWFESTGGVYLNEDVVFCTKAKKLGFRVFATADVVMGHIGIYSVRPLQRNGHWGALTEFSSSEEQYKRIFMPDVEEQHEAVRNGR